jgi:Flp pilus assembly protein TadG
MLSMPELTLLRIVLDARIDRARSSERGASAVEWVVITAFLVAIVGVVAAVIRAKPVDKANSIAP